MRERIGPVGAAFVFTVVLPTLVGQMMPHLAPAVGWPLIAASLLVGVAFWWWGLSPRHTSPLVGPLAGLTNSQLRERSIVTANEMRAFEGVRKAKISKLLVGYERPADLKDRAASWAAMNGEHAAMRTNMETEFRISLRPEALVLRDELLKRLGAYPPAPSDGLALGDLISGRGVLDTGMLAGVSPISAAADLLEAMARDLP